MNEKYYTPDISEFHVGFEYQWKNKDNFPSEEYRESTIACGTQIDDILEPKAQYDIRVKHLDKEDIESLGWLGVIPSNVENKVDYLVTSWVTDMYNDGYILIKTYPYGNYKYCIAFGNYEKNRVCFEGNIKNKSELKKLMQQVGITSDMPDFYENPPIIAQDKFAIK